MIPSILPRHCARLGIASACLASSALVGATAASATVPSSPTTFTNVTLTAVGGNATALANCINAAKARRKVQQVSQCDNAPLAAGGGVALQGVNVLVQPLDPRTHIPKGAPQRFTNVNITARGGDATAVATCANQAKGGTVTQVNICTNAPTAVGGTVVLTDVNVTVGKVT